VREFVALDVGPADPGRRGAPEHLTVMFLGEVRAEQHAVIGPRLADVAATTPPFRLCLEGVGAFPSATRPRVVWIGVGTGREEVVRLAEKVRAALASEVPGETAPFVPHVTWFRVRSAEDARAASEILSGRRTLPAPRAVAVGELLLKESILGPGGAHHRTVAAFPLGGPAAP